MTLEGEYYEYTRSPQKFRNPVAILMTLEGEYYFENHIVVEAEYSRNPHDIGRRILRYSFF